MTEERAKSGRLDQWTSWTAPGTTPFRFAWGTAHPPAHTPRRRRLDRLPMGVRPRLAPARSEHRLPDRGTPDRRRHGGYGLPDDRGSRRPGDRDGHGRAHVGGDVARGAPEDRGRRRWRCHAQLVGPPRVPVLLRGLARGRVHPSATASRLTGRAIGGRLRGGGTVPRSDPRPRPHRRDADVLRPGERTDPSPPDRSGGGTGAVPARGDLLVADLPSDPCRLFALVRTGARSFHGRPRRDLSAACGRGSRGLDRPLRPVPGDAVPVGRGAARTPRGHGRPGGTRLRGVPPAGDAPIQAARRVGLRRHRRRGRQELRHVLERHRATALRLQRVRGVRLRPPRRDRAHDSAGGRTRRDRGALHLRSSGRQGGWPSRVDTR